MTDPGPKRKNNIKANKFKKKINVCGLVVDIQAV
ncbi:hypothetical protein Metho_1387 [Methanomethylovorans hollandica DSM 15978]|uniref:Uncharacterized protein n=1 Tax=Methanomethylovorans hollandica (strain DSM 15978 / NBRC 107637 / DMS1) TaxID=867904 RepID=L0KZS2_METHD|nr:hypothetical protein Metho_1387 [Methanomethylovorans hollandica DSM 15978]